MNYELIFGRVFSLLLSESSFIVVNYCLVFELLYLFCYFKNQTIFNDYYNQNTHKHMIPPNLELGIHHDCRTPQSRAVSH